MATLINIERTAMCKPQPPAFIRYNNIPSQDTQLSIKMARLRNVSGVSAAAADETQSGPSTAASSAAFANMTELTRPQLFHKDMEHPHKRPEATNSNSRVLTAGNTLICKKSSPEKKVKKQVLLKPMNFSVIEEDLSILTGRKTWTEEVRQRPRRTLFSPIKAPLRDVSSGASSMQSMISDSEGSSEISVPISLTSQTINAFEFHAKIPSNLVSDTKRQLFSPAKPKSISIVEFDTMIDALASTRLEDLMSDESEADDTFYDSIRDDDDTTEAGVQHERGMPAISTLSLLPPPCSTQSHSGATFRPVTPPTSPSKNKLVSPSKMRQRIPTPPHNNASPSAFWSIEKVNQWNDQHSPQKIVRSPKKSRFLPLDGSSTPNSSLSPRKQHSPSKPTQAEVASKRDFEAKKRDVAEAFLLELDETITDGQISRLAESTGGVRLNWSKTLNSTAGRANWKRTAIKAKVCNDLTNTTTTTEYRHHASIDLAEKVISDETCLLNVIAHEFCHLANFMVSGIKDRPHGAEFKSWGRKCSQAFADRGVKVTTKHTFEIDYKYIWACTNDDCQTEFQRHSKSIDPARHTCGVCRASLVQVKPVPRKGPNSKTKTAGGYAGFVKEHYAAVRQEMPGASQKDVMARIGEKYRAMKQESSGQANVQAGVSPGDLDELASKFDSVALEQ